MSSSKYCYVLDFINAKNKPLASIIEKACLSSMFQKTKNMTFLMPDAALTGDMKKMSPDDVDDFLNTHCISFTYYKTLGDMDKEIRMRSKDILKITAKTATQATLSTGHVITPTAFTPTLKSRTLAVYTLSKGKKGGVKGWYHQGPGGKYSKPTRGYKGGNDAELQELKTHFTQYEADFMLDTIEAKMKLENFYQCKSMDMLTHMLMSMEVNINDPHCKTLLKYFKPSSPLAFFFFSSLFTAAQNEEWVKKDSTYDKKDTYLKCQSGFPGLEAYYDQIFTSKSEMVGAVKMDEDLSAKLHDLYEEAFDTIKSTDSAVGAMVSALFKSETKFICWWLSMTEFCFLFNSEYVKASEEGDSDRLGKVFYTFKHYYMNNIKERNFEKNLYLCSADFHKSIRSTEVFCKVLAFVVDSASCMVTTPPAFFDGKPFIVKERVDKLAPNNIKLTHTMNATRDLLKFE